jgi:hypothetical protein
VIDQVKALLEQAEGLLDDRDHAGASKLAAEAYVALVQERPDLVVQPMSFDEVPIDHAREPTPMLGPWPEAQGVTVTIAEGRAPEIVLAKDHYTMSDAITYVEYVVDLVKFAERG